MKIIKGAVVLGGTSTNYPTGSWRDQRPKIDQANCKSCGICREVCPDSSVYVEGDAYQIDYMFCKGCGLCAYECPAHCILMVPEEK